MKNDTNLPRESWQCLTTIDDKVAPPPLKRDTRAKLVNANDIANEIARVYRATKSGEIDANIATKLTYILSTLAKIRVDQALEARIEALEERSYR